MQEIYKLWKDNIYISNYGNIKGKNLYKNTSNTNITYYAFSYKNKRYYLHKVVAELFIPNPNNKKTVDHINRNSLDNNVSNLRWATMKEQNENRNVYRNDKGQFKNLIIKEKNYGRKQK